MESSIERISPVECRVKVEIPWSDVSGRLTDKMRDLRRRARLPGFRAGKVPPQVLEKRFGKGVREELAGELVQETFQTVITEHEAQPLTQPVVEESSLEKEQPFRYQARFEVRPEIEPKDYTGVEVRRRPAVVEDSQVDAQLEERRKKLIELRPLPEEPGREKTQAGDVWTVDVEGTLGEQRVSRKDVRADIGETEGEFLPGLNAALENLELSEVGSIKQISFTPPEDRIRAELRGQEAKLELGLREVRVKYVPELDDEFAKDTGDAETLDELKAKIAEDLRKADAETAEREARRRLLESLLEANEFEPAPSMVAREVSAQVEQTKRQLAQQGMRLEHMGTNDQQYAARIRPEALFNVKAFLLLDAIGKKENIEVSDEDVQARLVEMAEESGQNVDRMKASMEKSGQLLMIQAGLREERIFDFLMEKAVVTEAPDPEPEGHDHEHGHEHDHSHDHG
ncbi:MAG: trigger factor [Nannocystaceae bacterium]|nr:trigger factor [bacterium]